MKIEWNREDNTISVGKAVFTSYMRFANSAAWASYVLQKNNSPERLSSYSKNDKERNKAAADALGCSRTVLFKHFKALQLKVFVAPVYDILKKVSFCRSGFDQKVLKQIHKNRGMIEQVYNDGLFNILPIVVESENSPQYLKKTLKGSWKIIANNSLNKNKAIAKASRGCHHISRMQAICDLPTTVIKNYNTSSPEQMAWIAEHFKGKWNKSSEITRQLRTFVDAQYLAEQLGQDVNPKWTPRRLKEEHDRMSKEITARKYPKDVFDSVRDVSVKTLNVGEYTATLLDSAFAVADEGNAMGHCVAGYSSSVRDGNYLVYSVTKAGERSSTIGINITKQSLHKLGETELTVKGGYFLQQQYGRYNATVKDQDEKDLANNIVKLLNEKKLDNPENNV